MKILSTPLGGYLVYFFFCIISMALLWSLQKEYICMEFLQVLDTQAWNGHLSTLNVLALHIDPSASF